MDKPVVNNNENNYFIPCPNDDNDKRVNHKITKQLQRDFEDVFSGMGCFDEVCSL